MLKLMIVDDESLFREALRKTIPWKDLDYEVCCEAENGFDALEKIAEFKPDVTLVDINMPYMDGIELAAEIKESGMDIRVIIITGYSEFNYARQAIEVGVENYLLKPVNEEQLIKVLGSIKKKIDIKIEELKKQVTVYKPVLKEMFLNNLLYGTKPFEKEELNSLKASLKMDPDVQNYQVVILELCERQEYKWDVDERQLWIFAVSNIINEIFYNVCIFESCQDVHGRICLTVHVKPVDVNWPQNVSNLCERIRISVEKYLKFSITIGISNFHVGLQSISKAYNEALYALKNRLIVGENKVILYENVAAPREAAVNIFTVEEKQQLLSSARMGDLEEVDEAIGTIFEKFMGSNIYSDLVMLKCMEMVSTCYEFVAGTGNDMKSIYGDDFNLLEEIQKKKTLYQLKSWIGEIFRKAMKYNQASVSRYFSRTIDDAKKYIDDNYGKFDLKIDDIARHTYTGYGHLCIVFKREMGKTINTYITEIRINKAKKFIDEGCHSVAAVSARVGYADANYFGKCFKKVFGITPGRYIENILTR